jgi:hypothetical protein
MPTKQSKYPKNWKAISKKIRFQRAKGQCECEGQCGLHRTNPGPRRCVEMNGQPAQWAKGMVMLTVAHLCHDPSCDDETHLRAMCNRCHLRYDVDHHKKNAAETRRKKKYKDQQELFPQEAT